MAQSPKRLKPRHIAVQGLRILLPHMVDELEEMVPTSGWPCNESPTSGGARRGAPPRQPKPSRWLWIWAFPRVFQGST